MRYLKFTLLACAVLLASGCAMDTTNQGCSLALSRYCGDSAADSAKTQPPQSQPQPDRFSALQTVLDQEIEQARSAQELAVSAMQNLPQRQRATAGSVRLADVNITDSQSGQTRAMRALQSVTVELPLAAKGRPEYTQAMNTLKSLANMLADNRGASSIVVDQAQADVRARRVNTSTGSTQTSNGKPVSVLKNIDPALPTGTERYTIEAGELRGQL